LIAEKLPKVPFGPATATKAGKYNRPKVTESVTVATTNDANLLNILTMQTKRTLADKNVVIPPNKTLTPISLSASLILSSFVFYFEIT
jgi:hypothetical protein